MHIMKPDDNPFVVYTYAAGIAGQVGCFLTLIIGGSVVAGVLLDQLLGTRPLFIFLFLLGSIPLNLWAVYQYTRYKTKSLQAATRQKEDDISDNQLES